MRRDNQPTPEPSKPCTVTGRHYYVNTADDTTKPRWVCIDCRHRRDDPLCPCARCQTVDLDKLRTVKKGGRE